MVRVAGDTFRAAAIDQLQVWADRVQVDIIRHRPGADPAAVAYDGITAAKARASDVVLIDTAGRLHTKTNLMDELRKIKRIVAQECPGAPHEVLLVLDATVGQNAIAQAKQFHEAVGVTAVSRWLDLADEAARGVLQFSIEWQLADLTGLFTTAAPVRLEPDVKTTDDVLFPPMRLENNLTFLGYVPVMTRVKPGGVLPVVTYWRVDGMLPPDLVVFSHLYGDLGAAPLANLDSISMRPISLAQRDVFMQVHLLRLPETLPERTYDIAVGAYRTQSSQRLQVLLEPDLRPAGTRLILYSVEVTSNP